MQWVYAQAGISIPRTNAWNIMTPTSAPQPGDLVVQNGGAHVGIYVGNGMMINAQSESTGVRYAPIWDGYWGPRFYAARRIVS